MLSLVFRASSRKRLEYASRGSLAKLQPEVDPDGVIEMAWGASFQWIAFGCETKYHQHQNNHTRLGRFLNSLGARTVANWWDNLDQLRQGGWYGSEPNRAEVQEAVALLEEIRLWATH